MERSSWNVLMIILSCLPSVFAAPLIFGTNHYGLVLCYWLLSSFVFDFCNDNYSVKNNMEVG